MIIAIMSKFFLYTNIPEQNGKPSLIKKHFFLILKALGRFNYTHYTWSDELILQKNSFSDTIFLLKSELYPES